MDRPLNTWADALRSALAGRGIAAFDRVVVLERTASTQDAARAMAGEQPGLVVLAGQQTSGRGRFGRAWDQGAGKGLAMTAVLDASIDAPRLALATGVAVARAIRRLAPAAGIGLRWPNDAVETGQGRKVAGVLVERVGRVDFVGFGVNVHQQAGDWPEHLRGTATSLAELGSTTDRVDTAIEVLAALDGALLLSAPDLAAEWRGYDVLAGRLATFTCEGREVTGIVESIDPAHAITLRLPDGGRRVLNASSASLIRPGPWSG